MAGSQNLMPRVQAQARVKAPLLKTLMIAGIISGLFVDSNNVTRGFIRLPEHGDD
jgi:hypothetical protein